MFDKWLKLPAHHYLHLTALALLIVGVSISNVIMSIGSIWLIANWLIEGQFNDKLNRFKKTKVLWAFIALFCFSAVTLIWSENITYGVKDLRIKLPFLIIPFVIGTSKPISKREFYWLIYAFLGSILITSAYNYIQYLTNINSYQDIREMSHFISHVRYSILINLGIFFTYYLFLKRKFNRIILLLLGLWFIFYLYKSQTINGYGLFIILFILSMVYWINQFKNKLLKRGVFIGVLLTTVGLFSTFGYIWFWSPSEIEKVDVSKLELYTANNNGYYHIKNSQIAEDGKLVYIYISEKECHKAWSKRSKMDFKGLDKKGQNLEGTLYRYMTSKALRKDSIGFLSLTDQDIRNVESGFPNYKINAGLIEKIRDLKLQLHTFKANGNPNGHSLIQRQIHLETGLDILKSHWLLGVGIGDVQSIFNKQYLINQTNLLPENQHRAHNQFLTIWISHGIIGLLLIVFIFIYPFLVNLTICDYLLCVVLLAFVFSFIWQDVLETQAGVTIFSLFYSLVVFKPSITNVKN